MTLAVHLTQLTQAIGADIKAILASRGAMANLTTTDKSSLVNAINELLSLHNALINDTATVGDTTHTWSANHLEAKLAALKTEILGGADAAWDTLKEIETWATSNGSTVSGLVSAVSKRVAFDAPQSLTTAEQLQACTNIGIGDPETDFSAVYVTAKA